MKKKTKIIISVLSIVLSLSLILSGVSFLCFRKDSDNNKNVAGAEIKDPVINAVISLTGGASFTMTTGQLIGEDNNENECAVFVGNGSTFTMDGGSISNFQAENGAGIYVANGGTCKITGGTLENLAATGSGGAIYVATGGKLLIEEASGKTIKFNNCEAKATNGGGGAIYNASIINNKITGVEFSKCKSLGKGGALYNSGIITCSSIIIDGGNNTATSIVNGMYGGAIYNSNGLFLTSSVIKNCKASSGGGAICVNGGLTNINTSIEFNNCKVETAENAVQGNAIHFYNSDSVVNFNYFTANKNETITSGKTATFIDSGGYPRFYNGTTNATNSIITGSPSISNASILPLNPGNGKLYNWNTLYYSIFNKVLSESGVKADVSAGYWLDENYLDPVDVENISTTTTSNPQIKISNGFYQKKYTVKVTKDGQVLNKKLEELKKYTITEDKLEFIPSGDGYLVKSKEGATGEVGIPRFHNNKPVVALFFHDWHIQTGAYLDNFSSDYIQDIASAFKNCSEITRVYLPATITSIPKYAFYGCSSLSKINLHNKITNIGESSTYSFAFRGCSSLVEVNIPYSLQDVGRGAFYNCPLERFIVDENSEHVVKTEDALIIKGSLFSTTKNYNYCDETAWSQITKIAEYAVSPAQELTSLSIPYNVREIGSRAAMGCSTIENINFASNTNLIEIGSSAFDGVGITSLVVPDSVESIRSYAFNGCKSLAEVILPESITTIPGNMFSSCSSLKMLYGPGVETVASTAFTGCSGLKSVYLGAYSASKVGDVVTQVSSSPIFYINDSYSNYSESSADVNSNYSIYYKFSGSQFLDSYKENETNSNRAIKITKDADGNVTDKLLFWQSRTDPEVNISSDSDITKLFFRGRLEITKLTINKNITIPAYSFKNCLSLKEISMSEVGWIRNNAFEGCESLTTLNLPDVVTISDKAFYNCPALTSVELPSVTTIGISAFSYASSADAANTSLTTVSMPNVQTVNDHAFRYQTKLGTGSSSLLSMPKLTSLGAWAFADSAYSGFSIPNIKQINEGTFYNCSKLNTINLYKVTQIGANAFTYCVALTIVRFAEHVTEDSPLVANKTRNVAIGNSAFSGCSELVNVLDSLEETIYVTIGDNAFNSCSKLSNFHVVMTGTIGAGAFKNCSVLNNINLGSVTEVGQEAFMNCESLNNTLIGGGIVAGNPNVGLPWVSMDSNDSIVGLALITTVKNYAFYGCKAICYIEMPNVKTIESFAFANCVNLEGRERPYVLIPELQKLYLPSIQTIGEEAFAGCKCLDAVVYPGQDEVTIEKNAFVDCAHDWFSGYISFYVNDSFERSESTERKD